MTVDTLEYATKLEKAGVSREQAAAHAAALRDAVAGQLVTKADLAETTAVLRKDIADVRAELKGEIASVRTELKGDIAGMRGEIAGVRVELGSLETRFIKYLVAQGIGTVVLTVSLVGILLRLMR